MREQKCRKIINRKSLLRFFFAALALCTAVSFLGDLAGWLVHRIGGISFPVSRAATIGIIGGADGPTAIFVTSSTAPVWHTILKLLLLVMGICGWHHMNKRK